MSALLYLSIFVVFVTAGAFPKDFQHSTSQLTALGPRLWAEVFPTAYNLTLRFEEDFAQTNSFTGSVIINITVDEMTTPDSYFQFHAKSMKIGLVMMTNKKGRVFTTFSGPDPTVDLVTVTPTSNSLEAGNYSLRIDYTGLLSETLMTGLYKSSYVDESGNTHYLVASQFEDNYARRAFPCFDEPAMKATFDITVIYPKGYHVKSNTEEGSPEAVENTNLEKVTFARTPVMSTYLVAILVSEYNCKQGDNFNSIVKVELCSQIDAEDPSAEFALEATPKILHFMSNFTNHTYDDIRKVTLAAVPDFSSGGMENWGLITFKESVLLWHQEESTADNKQQTLTILAHELAHQWFGNLVTLNWWNDLFLNEGFATLFSYYAADHVEPTWELLKQFVLEEVRPALHLDSLGNSLPLSLDVKNMDIKKRNKDLSYTKGASVIRMVQHFIGFKDFQTGIRRYMDTHKMGTATTAQLWESFREFSSDNPPYQNITTIMDSWVNSPGYPLIFVNARGHDVIISQDEYSLSGEIWGTEWYVPLTYSTSAEDANDTSTRGWLEPGKPLRLEGVLENKEWLILNNQQVGFYRVDYDNTLLSSISAALHADINSIGEMSRAALVDDQFSLARSRRKTYREFLNFLTFLKKDDSYYSWSAAFSSFSFLLQHTVNEGIRKHIINFIKEHMETLNKSSSSLVLPVDHISTLKQVLLSRWQCKLDDEYCVSDAVNKFRNYKACSGIKPPPDQKTIVYCYGLRNSTNCDDYSFLWEEYLQTRIPTEKLTILKSLGCTSNPYARKDLLTKALTGEEIRSQDQHNTLSSACCNTPDGVTSTLRFLLDNYDAIIELTSISNFEYIVSFATNHISLQSQIDILTEFNKTKSLTYRETKMMNNAIMMGELRLKIIRRIEIEFQEYRSAAWAVTISGGNYETLGLFLLGYTLHFYINLYF